MSGWSAMIGQGGIGTHTALAECPICWARGGGGHGGMCPNIGRTTTEYTDVLPMGLTRPPRRPVTCPDCAGMTEPRDSGRWGWCPTCRSAIWTPEGWD